MVPWVGLQFVIVIFPDHNHLLFYAVFANDFCMFSIFWKNLFSRFRGRNRCCRTTKSLYKCPHIYIGPSEILGSGRKQNMA